MRVFLACSAGNEGNRDPEHPRGSGTSKLAQASNNHAEGGVVARKDNWYVIVLIKHTCND